MSHIFFNKGIADHGFIVKTPICASTNAQKTTLVAKKFDEKQIDSFCCDAGISKFLHTSMLWYNFRAHWESNNEALEPKKLFYSECYDVWKVIEMCKNLIKIIIIIKFYINIPSVLLFRSCAVQTMY